MKCPGKDQTFLYCFLNVRHQFTYLTSTLLFFEIWVILRDFSRLTWLISVVRSDDFPEMQRIDRDHDKKNVLTYTAVIGHSTIGNSREEIKIKRVRKKFIVLYFKEKPETRQRMWGLCSEKLRKLYFCEHIKFKAYITGTLLRSLRIQQYLVNFCYHVPR